MANGVKEYKIVINNLPESISQVEALNKQLDNLEKRIKAIDGKGVSVGGGSKSTASLSEEEKLYNQIAATEEKIAVSKEKDYQYLLKIKDELKQAKVEAEGLAAASKLDENNYNLNTMEGIKEKLKDIKREMQTTDIGSDKFKQLTTEANDLNTKLKDIEATYGQFGRNVGNYQSAIQGFEGFKMKIGETEVQFNSLKDAMRSLKNEMGSLEMQNKGNTKEYDQLKQALDEVTKANQRLQSSMKDVENSSKFMDYMLDTMTSFTALASAGKGLSTFFGFDNSKVDESIKKLMALQNALKGLETLKRQMNTNEGFAKIFSSANSAIDAFSTKLLGTTKAVEGTSTAMKTATKASKAFSVALKGLGIGLIIAAIAYLVENWEKLDEEIQEAIPWTKQFGGVLGSLEAVLKGVGKAIINWFVTPVETSIKVVKNLLKLNLKGAWQSLTDGMNKQFKGTADAFESAMDDARDSQIRKDKAAEAEKLKMQMEMLEAQYGNEVKYTENYRKLLEKRNKLLKESLDPNSKTYSQDLHNLQLEETRQNKDYEDNAKKQYDAMLQKQKEYAQKVREADEELTRLRIANMKEGLNKTLTQLEEERKAKIAKIRETGINVAQLEAETNKYYEKEKQKAREEDAKQQEELKRELNERLLQLTADEAKKELEILEKQKEQSETIQREQSQSRFRPLAATYGLNTNFISDDEVLRAVRFVNAVKEMDRVSGLTQVAMSKVKAGFEDAREEASKLVDELERIKNEIEVLQKDMPSPLAFNLAESGMVRKNIDEVFKERLKVTEDFYGKWNETIKEFEGGYVKTVYKSEEDVYNKKISSYRAELNLSKRQLENEQRADEEKLKQVVTSEENREEALKKIREKYTKANEQLEQQAQQKINDAFLQRFANTKKSTENYYQDLLQELRDYQTAINTEQSKSPIYNSWGIIDINKTKENNKAVKDDIILMVNTILKKRIELTQQLENGLIDQRVFQNTSREMDRMLNDANNALEEVTDSSRNIIGEFMQSIQVYTQAFSQTLSGILDAVWTAQDAAYEREKEQLEKDTEELEEQLNKQKEITEKYKDDINDIESELSTARGDRRQELIDQLNAQKAAQRASLAEEKRIEKEKEKMQQKADKLDKEQKEKQKERDLVTAGINAGMAILGAAANHWPMPAIPLVAAATALGVAQIAKIKAQKYANGGLLEGNSHSQGGIPVGNTGIEVEGKEYIIRKKSTKGNVELLDYINRSERKLNIDDFIDFYSGRVKKNILSTSPARKYANGGELPLLNDGITINDRLLNAFERYAEKPTVVSVVEIEDRMEDVNSVRALAGAV